MAAHKLRPRQEAFVQAYLETGNASEAYRRAYPRSKAWKPEAVWVRASALCANDKVALRIDELTDKAAEAHQVTVETIARQLDEDREFARKCKTASAAVAASMGKAKLYGLITDKAQIDQAVAFVLQGANESETDEEWLEHHAPPSLQ